MIQIGNQKKMKDDSPFPFAKPRKLKSILSIEDSVILSEHPDRICSINIVGNNFLASYFSGEIMYWNINSDFRRNAKKLTNHTNAVFNMVRVDSEHFVSCSADSTIRLWVSIHLENEKIERNFLSSFVKTIIEPKKGKIHCRWRTSSFLRESCFTSFKICSFIFKRWNNKNVGYDSSSIK